MIRVGFCNLKGGVGKTTACQNIAAGLAKLGRRVAVVDMDPQSNLSAGFGLMLSPTDPQVFDLLSGAASWDDIVQTKENVDIIPSSLNLVLAEMNESGPMSKAEMLKDVLNKIDQNRYDYVLVDSPPQLGIFTRNVLAACENIIIAMDGGFYSLFGLRLFDRSMSVFRERLNPDLKISGILMTNYNPRLYIARKIFDEVKKNFGDVLFENYARQNVSIVEASSMGQSIFAYDKKSKGAECYEAITQEFLRRFESGAPVVAREVPAPAPKPEPEPIPEIEIPEPMPEPAPEPEKKPEPLIVKAPDEQRITLGAYEEGIKQDILDMLPENEKAMWRHMFGSVKEITRGEIDVKTLREDFESSDKNRYTFYILNDEEDSLWPVMYPDQIIEPLRCVVKWDEHGTADVYM